MYKVKSKFIKNKIKGHSFKNKNLRQYIDDLIFLEKSITKGINGMAGNWMLFYMKEKYEKDYYQLLKELKPKEYRKYAEKRRKEQIKLKEREKRWKEKEKKELNKKKKLWLSLGGKI